MKTSFLVVAVLATSACNGPWESSDLKTVSADPHNPCNEYIAAYDGCLDKLGPEAKAIGERNLAAAKEQIRNGATDPAAQLRCKQAKTQVETACR